MQWVLNLRGFDNANQLWPACVAAVTGLPALCIGVPAHALKVELPQAKRMSCSSARQQWGCAPPGSAAAVNAASALHRTARALPQQHQVPVVPSRWVVLRPLQPLGMV